MMAYLIATGVVLWIAVLGACCKRTITGDTPALGLVGVALWAIVTIGTAWRILEGR